MRYKRYIKISLILIPIILILISILMFIPIILVAHDFTDIGYYSILKYYLVDKEIRNLPIIKEGSNVSYSSSPSDGKPFVSSGVALTVDNEEKYYWQSIKYFISLGYTQSPDCEFRKNKENYCYLIRNEYKIGIVQERNHITVTKYTPDNDT